MNDTLGTIAIALLKIRLLEVEPPVWRRILVPFDITLGQLHEVIQSAMGWTDSHLHEFRIAGVRYGIPESDYWGTEPEIRCEDEARLADVLDQKGPPFAYIYDFGDYWVHELSVEDISQGKSEDRWAICLEGERSCPPEDVGGPFSYSDFLEALADPTHEDHHHFSEWAGEFDPEAFDVAAINKKLQLLSANLFR